MPSSLYFGPNPVNADDIMAKLYADGNITAGVAPNTLQNSVGNALTGYASLSYVQGQDSGFTSKAYTDQQDATKIPLSQRGASGGVIPLDANGQIPASHLTNAIGPVYAGPFTPSTANWDQEATQGQDKLVCTINIPAQAFSYRPIFFGHFEVYSPDGNARCDVSAKVGSYELGRACAPNSAGYTGSLNAVMMPRSDTTGLTPAGWTTALTAYIWQTTPFAGTHRFAGAGKHVVAYAVPAF